MTDVRVGLMAQLAVEHEVCFGWLPSEGLTAAVIGATANGVSEREVRRVFFSVVERWKNEEVRGAVDDEIVRLLRAAWRDAQRKKAAP